MRVSYFFKENNFDEEDSAYTNYIQFTSPLLLNGNPTNQLHAVSKQYVDSIFSYNMDASRIISGVISRELLPPFNGDISNPDEPDVFVLKSTGLPAGIFTKVITDRKGIIVGTGNLELSDVPQLNWSKLSSDKPNTLGGYGIIDGVSLLGGNLPNNLEYLGPETHNLNPVTKYALPWMLSTVMLTNEAVGNIVERPNAMPLDGFLRCNGGQVAKEDYAGLYEVIGDLYSAPDYSLGAGKPWINQSGINNVGTKPGTWTTNLNTLVEDAAYHCTIVTKNRVYVMGGITTGNLSSDLVQSAPLLPDGSIGIWVREINRLPLKLHLGSVSVLNNKVYIVGGRDTPSLIYNTVLSSDILPDGSLGVWKTEINQLPETVYGADSVVVGNKLYLFGGSGSGGDYLTKIYSSEIQPDGSLGVWGIENKTLSIGAFTLKVFASEKRVYVLSGISAPATPILGVYSCPIMEDGSLGAWVLETSPLPQGLYYSQAMMANNKLYLIGGFSGTSSYRSGYSVPILEDGSLGTWGFAEEWIPGFIYSGGIVVSKDKVHVIGGVSSGNFSKQTHSSTFLGGKNDYSTYYDGSLKVVEDPDKFFIPDLSGLETDNKRYYIKY